ncbi:hypothetical protein HN682_06800 [Candidatus Peregrinibacteria bacterium]|jgi:hypothetical protein|nr:hypothetical protein [Candidatus Peregrinibacteria bacterium]
MSNEANYYGILPAQVRYNKNLTLRAIVLYSELTALTSAKGYCWATNKHFADLYKVTTTSISICISLLEKEGFITTTITPTKYGNKRKIYLNPLKENLKTPLKENLKSYNSNNTSKKERVSKDTVGSSNPERIFKSAFTEKCILGWNEYQFVQKIRVTSKTNNIMKIEKFITQLLKGTFLNVRGNKTYDAEWFKQNKIPFKLGKLTKKQILQTIRHTSLYSEEGYFPENKKHMPNDLATLIYNPRTGKSWFLKAYHYPPKPLHTQRDLLNPDIKTTNYLIKQLGGGFNKASMGDRIKLYRGVLGIKLFVENIPKRSLRKMKIELECGSALRITKEYIRWVSHRGWIDKISLGILNTENKVWKGFIAEKEEDYQGYKLK